MNVYSGTLLANYFTCAEKRGDRAVFLKSREPRHRFDALFCEPHLDQAFVWAVTAILSMSDPQLVSFPYMPLRNLPHVPVVIAGEINETFHGVYPVNQPFPVDKIWLPTEEAMELLFSQVKRDMERYYTCANPLEVLLERAGKY